LRVLLVALNAKYVHTNLALRYLRAGIAAVYSDVLLREFSINERLEQIAGEIYEVKANVIGFSCYIWNIKEIMAVIRQLHPVCPDIRFVLGGPEVSFEVEEFILKNPEIDAIVVGEGEKTFLELLQTWQEGRDISQVLGIVARAENGKVMVNAPRLTPLDLNALPFPYAENEDFTGRLVYVETTRGCPFNCQYCLSSTFQGVRFLEPERFRQMFRHLIKNGARTIKFVDRTFNANKRHALRILDIVREESEIQLDASRIRVHCEMAGDLFNEDWMKYFQSYPSGLIQLEIGVQSTHQPTLELVSRPQNFRAWKKYIPVIQALGIPLHLDLIAGLPQENWTNFRTSFNDVYEVKSDMLQLGFLKVLKGSGLRRQSSQHGLVFTPDPPYTILETPVLSYSEILQLHRLEDVLDKYYNSGKFRHALSEAIKLFPTPFDFYHGFAEFWQQNDWFLRKWQGKALFDKLWQFLGAFQALMAKESVTLGEEIRDALRFDYYLWERPNSVPDYLSSEACEAVRRDDYWENVVPEFQQMDRRQWNRNTAVAYFTSNIVDITEPKRPCWYLFHYQQGGVKAYRYKGSLPKEDPSEA